MIIEPNSKENNNNINYYNNLEKGKKAGVLTSRHFSSSPNKFEEGKIIKNILISPSSGNIAYMEKKIEINKNKKIVIPKRKRVKRISHLRDNIPLTSRCLLNTSSIKNKRKAIITDKNHFNIGGGIVGNSNSIINKGIMGTNDINNNDINTICSIKSIGHIFKKKKNSNPYIKPSLNFMIANNK